MKAPKTVPYKPCDGLDCDLCSPFQCDLLDTPLPPPPSPLQAKKDHALKQQKLLEKLNKKSKKKEVK